MPELLCMNDRQGHRATKDATNGPRPGTNGAFMWGQSDSLLVKDNFLDLLGIKSR